MSDTTASADTRKTFGYARVSTTEQHLDRQLVALRNAGVADADIFTDKISGICESRPGLDALLAQLRRGDTVIVVSLDRLARSTKQLTELMERFNAEGIQLQSLRETIDTTTPQGRMFFTFVAAIAQFERENIKERQREGIATARAKGVKFGRPGTDPETMDTALRLYQGGNLSVATICERTGVSRSALYRAIDREGVTRAARA